MKKILLSILVVFIAGCFGSIDKRGSVKSYINGVVKTEGGSFRVSTLPSPWVKQKTRYSAVLFLNTADQSTITIDSWCKGSFDDSNHEALTRDLYRGIRDFKISEQKMVPLSVRKALYTAGAGSLDGSDIYFSSYVLTMNACVFDFVYISVPDEASSINDFKAMVSGFEYISGPKVLE